MQTMDSNRDKKDGYLFDKKVMLLYPTQSFLFDDFKAEGYYTFDPFIGRNRLAPRILRELHFKYNLPHKSIWYTKMDTDDVKVIIAHEGYLNYEYIRWLKSRTSAEIYVCFSNKVEDAKCVEELKAAGCRLLSSDKNDCILYDLEFLPFHGYLRRYTVDKKPPEMDAFYIGMDKGQRKGRLMEIRKIFEAQGLKLSIHLTSPYPYGITMGKYEKKIAYTALLDKLSSTRCIVHLSEGAMSGITYRLAESAVHQIKLITDDPGVVNTEIYCRQNVFIWGKDNTDTLKEFLESPFQPLDRELVDSLYLDTFARKLLEAVE